MDWRLIATSVAGIGGSAFCIAAVAFVIAGAVPREVRKAPSAPPSLLVTSPVEPAPAPASPASGGVKAIAPRAVAATPEVQSAEAESATASISALPVRRDPGRKGADAIVLGRLQDPPENPVVRRAARTSAAALPSREDQGDPIRPGASAAPAVPPIPLRTAPERRADGVLTAGEIRRIKLALRLTPEQERHWPPVEALLADIAAQQAVLVQAGRPATDAFGFGTKMRAYSATRPLIALLQEDQKAEIRRRARAMGFDAVASAI